MVVSVYPNLLECLTESEVRARTSLREIRAATQQRPAQLRRLNGPSRVVPLDQGHGTVCLGEQSRLPRVHVRLRHGFRGERLRRRVRRQSGVKIGRGGAKEKHVLRQLLEAGSLARGSLELVDDIAPPVTTVRDPVLEQAKRGRATVWRAVRQRAFEPRGGSEARIGEEPPDLELGILTLVEPPE